MKVTVYKNGAAVDGKTVLYEGSLVELKRRAASELGCTVTVVYNERGGRIEEDHDIKDGDVLYAAANGEPFIPTAGRDGPGAATSWVTLNVGGRRFTTSLTTLTSVEPDSMLARMFSADHPCLRAGDRDSTGAFLVDRSPAYFEPILNYLRTRQLILDPGVNPAGVLEEARYFGIESLVGRLEALVSAAAPPTDHAPLTRAEVIRALLVSRTGDTLRFQGVNCAGTDLSRLDLRNINFKYACLRGCDLSFANLTGCCLERADLSGAKLDSAQLACVRMIGANLESASMRSCNFEDPAGARANLEGAKMKGAVLSGSNMTSINLRVATLKNANLQDCDLRLAILAGADLENCDLSGSDLHEANLRGANLKNTAFELMLTPLHMSQTVR